MEARQFCRYAEGRADREREVQDELASLSDLAGSPPLTSPTSSPTGSAEAAANAAADAAASAMVEKPWRCLCLGLAVHWMKMMLRRFTTC